MPASRARTPTSPSTTTRSAPAAVARSSSTARVHFAGSDSALNERGARRRPRASAPPAPSTSRSTSARSRSSSTSRASPSSTCSAATIARIFDGKITTLGRPGDRGGEPRRHAPGDGDHAGAPLRRVGHHEELHRLPGEGRPAACGRTRPTATGPSRAASRRRAPRASSRRSRAATAPSVRRRLGRRHARRGQLKVGEEWVAPSEEAAAAAVDASPRDEERADGDIVIKIDRDDDRGRRLPADPRVVPRRVPRRTTRPGAGRPGQGLPRATS